MATASTRAEQEVIFNWDREEQIVHICVCDPVTWRKLEKLKVPVLRENRANDGTVRTRFYAVPLSHFRWSIKTPRTMTAEAASAAGERLRRHREAKLDDGQRPGP